jgi:hypothetical protein
MPNEVGAGTRIVMLLNEEAVRLTRNIGAGDVEAVQAANVHWEAIYGS